MAEQSHIPYCERWIPLSAPHSSVTVQVFQYREADDCFRIFYRGKPAELIASGAVPAVALQPYNKRGPRPKRVDEDGDACYLQSGSLSRGSSIEVCRYKSPEGAAKLPGVTRAMLDEARLTREDKEKAVQRGDGRGYAIGMASEFLREMPRGGFSSTEEALRFLADLRDLIQLPEYRKGCAAELAACARDGLSLSQTVRLLKNLPSFDDVATDRPQRVARALRLVVDNTR